MDALLNHAPCGFVSFTDDGAIEDVNDTLLRMVGYDRDEVAGRHVEILLTVGSRIFYQTHLFPLVRMHGRAEEIFLTLRPKSGHGDVGVLMTAARRERGGRAVTSCVFLEVRERRKFEDALLRARQTAEAATAALAERNAELERANDLLGTQALELEMQHQRLHEQTAELEAQQDELQRVNHDLVVGSEELERQRNAAEAANRAKSTFLAVMSHELRTPLNAIGGYVQLLDMGIHGPVTAAQREALDRVARSQRHLLRLINELLDLARIESGRVEYMMEPVPLAEVVATVLPMVEPQLAAKGIACASAGIGPELVARADREKVQQILLNLLGNAVKFTAAGGRVTVDGLASVVGGRPGAVCLRVADTGVGIPADKLEAIFEPFVQVDASHTGPIDGAGLGLAISRELARGMGGELRAQSVAGAGSTFLLELEGAAVERARGGV